MFCRPFQPWPRLTWSVAAALLVSSCTQVFAEEDAFIRVKQWTTDEGLPQNRVSCLKQTHDGYLWIGTWFGLVRFNGVSFTVFNKFNTPALKEDTISALAEDSEGNLWIGTNGGLVRYREHHFERFSGNDALPDPKIWHLVAARSGGLWIQSGPSLMRLKGEKLLRVFEWPRNPICDVEESADGWLHLVLHHAWLTFSPDAREVRTNALPNLQSGWLAGTVAKDGTGMWGGGTNGLELIQAGMSKGIAQREIGQRQVDRVYEDRAGYLWVAVQGVGLYRWDRQRWLFIDVGERVRFATVVCFEEDQEGSLWVGTNRGLLQVQKLSVRTFTARDGLPNENVCSLCEGPDGAIWAGTELGLGCIRNDRVVPLGVPEPYTAFRDRCVWPNGKGGVWIAKERQGLYEFQDGNFVPWAPETNFAGALRALFTDRSGRLWVGSATTISTFQNERITPQDSSGETNDIRAILQDTQGTFWFGTRGQGLLQMRQNVFIRFTQRHGLSDDSVWSIHEDANGSLWLGTANGLTRYRKGTFFAFTRNNGPQVKFINCVLEDDLGFLWLSGLQGLERIKRSQLDAVADDQETQVECALIDTTDGMESSETNGERQPSGWKARDGRLWFPTIQGVVVVDPKRVENSKTPPPVQVEQVIANEEVIYGDAVAAGDPVEIRKLTLRAKEKGTTGAQGNGNRVRLGAGQAKVIEFRFTANTFVNAKRARFRYRLSRADNGWRDVTTERVARYTNLRPGPYDFEVKAANHLGIWNPVPKTFRFVLAPYFWETWEFYALCIGAGVGLAFSVQAYRLRWQRRFLKLEQQRALANERTRIARDLHDDLGTALTGLALEMDVAGRDTNAPAPVTERLGQAAQRTRQLAERMREVVWTVNPKCDTLLSLADFLEQQVSQFLRAEGMRVLLEFPEDIPALPLDAEARHQLALSVREALTNVVRHAGATEVVLSLAIAEAGKVASQPATSGNKDRTDALRRIADMRSRENGHATGPVPAKNLRERITKVFSRSDSLPHNHSSALPTGRGGTSGPMVVIQVADNGCGFRAPEQNGHGLNNMRARMEQVHGTFDCVSTNGQGTVVTFCLPLRQAAHEKGEK